MTLLLSGGTLYALRLWGPLNGGGTIFAINTYATGFTVLHTFKGADGENPKHATDFV